MKNLKLGMRLGLGFGLMILLMGILVFFGVTRVSDLNAGIEKVVKNQMVKTRQVNAITVEASNSMVNLRDLIITLDPKVVQSTNAQILNSLEIITKLIDSLDESIKSEEGKKNLQAMKEAQVIFRDDLNKTRELGLKNTEADNAAAQKIIFDELRPSQDVYATALDNMIKYETGRANEEGEKAGILAASTENILIILALIALAIGLFAAFIITKSITAPISKCIEIAEKVANGDTSVAIVVDSTDETGMLLMSLKNMVGSIQRMTAETVMLAKAAVEGKLATRADASKHEGDFRKIVQGVNDTLDAVINPLNVAAKYVDDISKGNIPAKITDTYNGDFNVLKNNLNTCIGAVNMLVADANLLAKAAVEGKLATRADATKHQGDFRVVVQGVNDTLDAVITPVNEAAAVLDKVAARDMTSRMVGNYNGDLAKIKNSLNLAVDNLDSALGQVGDATSQVASASQQISSGSQSLAQGANEQAGSLEEVSSSLEEMSAMTRQNADNAIQAKNLAGEANGSAREGTEAMNRMSSAINKIKESSDQTAKIIKTIDEIAMQTNLLALNAAVEAARAGDAGRGFAVVAEEVRNLAQRSAQAAKNTADMIGESVKNADDGVKIATEVSKSFISIAGGVKKVNDLITEIAAASKEQAQGLEQVNTAVSQMDKVTQQNAANSEESASAAEELSSQAEELQAMVNQFQLSQVSNNTRRPAVAHSAGSHPRNAALSAPKNVSRTATLGNRKISSEQIIPLDDSHLKEF